MPAFSARRTISLPWNPSIRVDVDIQGAYVFIARGTTTERVNVWVSLCPRPGSVILKTWVGEPLAGVEGSLKNVPYAHMSPLEQHVWKQMTDQGTSGLLTPTQGRHCNTLLKHLIATEQLTRQPTPTMTSVPPVGGGIDLDNTFVDEENSPDDRDQQAT
ncbi:MAG: hypothetical protein ASARMPREDX12_005855, partial [Alectoria sarmentosa]